MTHTLHTRVWYEDTDLGGIVYYANYLKFIERGRSAMIEAAGIDQLALREEGYVLAVRRVEADYLLPARYGDALTIHTGLRALTAARAVLDQQVRRGSDDALLFTARVTIVCLRTDGRPVRLPGALRAALTG
ncbi:MAG: YbgC/FadM family acyl-CoA thioesterase [Alphaproteobacteria bacterium]|nr:MAG: YbgC/FadM family acyl-CoA thioesterase [Alphaproteobacteria bacterium]